MNPDEYGLPIRWYPLRYHEKQSELWNSSARFRIVPAGRRSGKTELAKRFLVEKAITEDLVPDAWYVFAAPTHKQAKRIFWPDLKRLIPPEMRLGRPMESELTIRLINGAEITVLGLDQPDRIEGRPLDGIVVDEFGNTKVGLWEENIRPALSTVGRRPGWAWLIGVPEGRNHYYRIYQRAIESVARLGEESDWAAFTWESASIIDPAEIEAAKRDLDELTFNQEYKASFLNFTGRAYYPFTTETHAAERVVYDPGLPLIFTFDFNVEPGVAGVLQEQSYTGDREDVANQITASVGEVWIPKNSNTPLVCKKLIHDWGPEGADHQGDIYVYGDATGGARGTAKVKGSDWDLVRAYLKPVFGHRLKMRVKKSNPAERSRVNAVNSRLRTADGLIHFLVDPTNCPNTILDFEGVVVIEGGSGELDKDDDPDRTHMTDGIGYYVFARHPINRVAGIQSDV